MLFIARRDGATRRLSAPLARLLGPDAGEGTSLPDRVHSDDRPAFDIAWDRLLETAAPLPFDCRLKCADGTYKSFSWRVSTPPGSDEIHGSLRADRAPLTAEIQSRLRKAEHEAQILHLLQETVPVVVWAIDSQGVFTHHAGKALGAANLEPGQLLGMSILELYGGAEDQKGTLRRALNGEPAHTFGQTHGRVWENWYIPVRDAQGQVTSVVGISLDISEVRHAEEALKEKLALIERQQRVISTLEAPIIEVWDRVLALPLLGVIDSARGASMMEGLLGEISRKRARFALLDLTGVEAVDAGTASHLLNLIRATRLLGTEGIITGIRPALAQMIVTLGLDLGDIVTLATLRNGIELCMQRIRDAGRRNSRSSM